MEITCPKCNSNKIFKPTKVKMSGNSRKVIGLNIKSHTTKQYDYKCINCGNEIFI